MEKYLKAADASGSCDASVAHATFDLTGWAHNLSSSHRNPEAGRPEQQGSAGQRVDGETLQKPTRAETQDEDRGRGGGGGGASSSLSGGPSKRSSIPRPRASFSSARRSMGSGQASAPPPADNDRPLAGSGGEPEPNPQATGNTTSQQSDPSSAGSPVTPPGPRKGQASPPCSKGPSSPPQRMRSAGQQDRRSRSPEKKPPSAPSSVTGAPTHAGFSCQNTRPPPDATSGE